MRIGFEGAAIVFTTSTSTVRSGSSPPSREVATSNGPSRSPPGSSRGRTDRTLVQAGLDPVIVVEQMRLMERASRPEFLRTDVPWENVRYFFRHFREDVLRLVEPRPE